MIRELNQRTIFVKRRTVIEENKILYYETVFGKEMSASVAYEDLSANKMPHTIIYKNIGLYIGLIAFATCITYISKDDKEMVPYLRLVFALFLVATCMFHYLYKETVWKLKLHNLTYIFINMQSPDKNEVDNFINALFEQRRKYLRETYLHISRNLPYEPQFNNLKFLKKSEAISGEEYLELIAKLDTLFDDGKKPIGFFAN